jgi:hypothetical protein
MFSTCANLFRKSLIASFVFGWLGVSAGAAQQDSTIKLQPSVPANAPSSEVAQSEPAAPQEPAALSERDALKKAVGNSRQLAAFRSQTRVLEQRAGCTSCNWKNPELRISDLSTKYFYSDPTVNKQFHVGVRWQPPKIGEMGARQQREVVELWEKKVDEDKFRRKFVADIRKTYAELAYFEQSSVLAARLTTLEERRNAAVQRLVGIGQKALLDQIKGRRRLIKAREESGKLARRYVDTKNKLRSLIGEKGDIRVDLGPAPERVPAHDKLHAQAVKNRSDLGLMEEQGKLYDYQYRETRYAQIPWFSFVEAGYHHESVNLDWGELRFAVEIPVFRWGSGALDATATASNGRTQYEAATIESIDREVAKALSAYQEALTEWQSLKVEADSFVPGTDALVDQAQRQPSVPINDVIDLEVSTIELQQMVLEARLELALASIELCEAVGVDSWQELSN